MIKWYEWDDRELLEDSRFKLIFIKRLGQEESEYMEKGIFGRKGIESYSQMYMPILVESQERPDVSMKYGLRNTPSVVITTKDGRIIGGGGVANYETFIKFMIELGTIINKERDTVEKIAAEDMEEDIEDDKILAENKEDIVRQVEKIVEKLIDGLSKAQDFSTYWLLSALEYLLKVGDKGKSQTILSILEKNEDKVESGLFSGTSIQNPISFSTFKESYLNIKYARLLSKIDESKADKILKFVESLRSPSGLYFSCLMEDSEYYKSTEGIRKIRSKPNPDSRIFFSENASIAEEFCYIGDVNNAKQIMGKLEEVLIEKSGEKISKVYHSNSKNVFNLLIDIAWGASAYSTIFRVTGENVYKEKTQQLISLIDWKKGENLFYEFDPNGFGFIKKKKIDLLANLLIARSMEKIGMNSDKMKISLLKFIQLSPWYFVEWLL